MILYALKIAVLLRWIAGFHGLIHQQNDVVLENVALLKLFVSKFLIIIFNLFHVETVLVVLLAQNKSHLSNLSRRE